MIKEEGGMGRDAAGGSTDHIVSARMGGSTYVFGLPGEPCAPAEVIGFPEFSKLPTIIIYWISN